MCNTVNGTIWSGVLYNVVMRPAGTYTLEQSEKQNVETIFEFFLIQNNLTLELKMCDVDELTSKLLELFKQLATSSQSHTKNQRYQLQLLQPGCSSPCPE